MTHKMQYSLRLLIALILSLVINYFFSATQFFLMPLTTLFVMQTSIGNEFYHGMKKWLLIIIIVSVAALILYSFKFFYAMMHDVLIGGVIGILLNLFLLPRAPDREFREKILPIIKTFNDYFSKIIDRLLQQENGFTNADLENALLKLPDWVYERGFNGALQAGYEFFLQKVEQMSDVLMSMHHLSRYQYDKELIAKIRPTLLQYVEHVNQFFLSVVTVIELKTLAEPPSDLEHEIVALQKQFFAIVPTSLELLDMRRDYVYLAAFIFDLKNLRQLLLKMGEALR